MRNMVTVNLQENKYQIFINNDFNNLVNFILETNINSNSKIVIITDNNVDYYYGRECHRILEESGYDVYKYVLEAGEKSKNLETVFSIYKYLLDNSINRDDSILALGGGVVGDVSGFAAATFLRGINYIQVPTTLLAQVDSSVGGKVGVDLLNYKNIIGSFYQPKMVYINVSCLKTLSIRELRAGLAEVIVHAIIMDKEFFYYIKKHINMILKLDEKLLQQVVKVNCKIKSAIVEKDEKDRGIRAVLNFGHTIGHAVETSSGFRLLHGECVSIGIIAAFHLAMYVDLICEEILNEVIDLLKKVGLPTKVKNISIDDIYSCMFHDKKIKNNNFIFILPKDIGDVIIYEVQYESLIKKAISQIID